MDNKNLTNEQKLALLKAIAENPEARSLYIKTRAAVIEPLIRKDNQVRNIFKVENLPAGGQGAYYPIGSKEMQTVWIAPAVGSAPRRSGEGDEVWLNTFPIYGRVEWHMDVATDGRFSIADEMNFYMAEQIKAAENEVGWNLIKAAAADATHPSTSTVKIGTTGGVNFSNGEGFFSKQLFSALQLAADKERRVITDIYMSPQTMFDIFNYWGMQFAGTTTGGGFAANLPQGASESIHNAGAPVSGTQDTEFIMNLMGVRFHKVYDSDIVDNEHVYALDLSGSRSTFGVMPIRDTLKTYEDPIAVTEFKVGYFGRERVGFGILDSKNLFVGEIDRTA